MCVYIYLLYLVIGQKTLWLLPQLGCCGHSFCEHWNIGVPSLHYICIFGVNTQLHSSCFRVTYMLRPQASFHLVLPITLCLPAIKDPQMTCLAWQYPPVFVQNLSNAFSHYCLISISSENTKALVIDARAPTFIRIF